MLKIGVLGAGHLGKIHIKCILQIEEYELVGFYDPDKKVTEDVKNQFNIKSFDSLAELIENCDLVDIVTPTLSHYDCARSAIMASKHIFIEKPITNTTEEAKSLMNLAEEAKVKVQVGHVERFNPAFLSVQNTIENPMFIETHRLTEFNARGTDVSVIHDLMIHDIDIILSIVKSNVKRISANGVAVVSETPDIANARIEFDNGCVANLTASRVSLTSMRKTRIFQKNAYITIDFSNKTSQILQLSEVTEKTDEFSILLDLGKDKKKKEINFVKPEIKENNAIKDELTSFAKSILNNHQPLVTVEDGYNALRIASIIHDKMKFTADNF
ncbi:Gfo/Idh/MocA family oxidoreductase [Flavobacteriales bacterium]|nr:Gfo/Idh/MocA family oxidoreductase [Flavobacteriales bacterium]MDB4051837.1 Gfo/Idh/MocA family oxidoreductase [Flavobacteriales bacterium]